MDLVYLLQSNETFTDDGIQIEPFNLSKEREEGYFDAAGNYVEYVNENEIKVSNPNNSEITRQHSLLYTLLGVYFIYMSYCRMRGLIVLMLIKIFLQTRLMHLKLKMKTLIFHLKTLEQSRGA